MRRATFLLIIFMVISDGPNLQAYDPDSHGEIARRSAQSDVSTVDQHLKTQLGMHDGINEKFFPGTAQERTVQRLIIDGARFEDSPQTRPLRHFHDPLYQADGSGDRGPWSQAGLFGLFQSSVQWGQNPNQGSSWQDARQRYLSALTGFDQEGTQLSPKQREQAFAETFRTLGQLTHLIQDLSVPAHVRDDAHPTITVLGFEIPINPDRYEKWASRQGNQSLVQTFLARQPIKPDQSIFTLGVPIPDSIAKVPVARLWDTDQYTGSNPDITRTPIVINPDGTQTAGQPRIGLAEYTNANFFSDDTVLKDFPFPARTSVELGAEETEPNTKELRRYFQKARDGETGYRLAVPSQLHKFLPEALKDKKIGLDDKVYEDYAAKLLPRAVGYSAGLLDYFFRGKLDVDLVPDPQSSDPTVVKLSGTNGSEDKLDGGTLTLYADDPVTGERTFVPALEPNFTVVANKGEPVESAKFQITAEAERFLAVYKGKLGDEKPEGTFPGGVIGKVLGGVRAESIFPQGNKRMLRTVDGIFPLPPTADRLQNIQWGDLDNTFVGTLSNSSNPTSPDQVIAFKINRPLGSGEEPPLIDMPDGTKAVSADILKASNFPFGLSLGVTVNYSQAIHFQQFLLTYENIVTHIWDGLSYGGPPQEIRGPTEAETVVDRTVSFAQNFPIILDLAHLLGGPVSSPRPYFWNVAEVGFDAQGRLLAHVRVVLNRPDDNVRTVNLRKRNQQCQLVEDLSQGRDFFGNFQVSTLLSALIDVEKGKVLGTTASSTFSPSSQIADSQSLLQQRFKEIFIGGPFDGFTQDVCSDAPFPAFANPNYTTVETATITLSTIGLASLSLPGRFRADLEPLGNAPIGISTTEFEFPTVYYVDSVTRTNKAIRLINSFSFRTDPTVDPPQAKIMRPTKGTSSELFLLFSHRASGIRQGIPVRWSPEFPANTAVVLPEKLPGTDFYSLRFTTSEAALIDFSDLDQGGLSSTLLIDFGNKNVQDFPEALRSGYVLLDPKFLYNINDTRFHTLDALLPPTVLPRRLASAPPIDPPSAAYHLIQLR